MHRNDLRNLVRRSAALAVLSTAFALTACGGGGGGGSTAATPPSTAAPAPIPAPSPTPAPEPTPITATTATVQWQAPETMTDGSPVTDIVGYRIYYGTDVAQMTQTVEVANPGVLTYVVEGLSPGTYYFAVTALHSSSGESERSNAGRKIIS